MAIFTFLGLLIVIALLMYGALSLTEKFIDFLLNEKNQASSGKEES